MASNVKGFIPYRYLNGSPYNGAATMYAVATDHGTVVAVGDLVKLLGTNDTVTGTRIVGAITATTDAVVGAVVGIKTVGKQLSSGAGPSLDLPTSNRVGTSPGHGSYVYVADDPNLLFSCLEDAAGTPLTIAAAGLNISPVVGAASTVTGVSGHILDSSTVSTTATLPLKIVEFAQTEDNLSTGVGTTSSRWIVKINNHQLASSTGTAGV